MQRMLCCVTHHGRLTGDTGGPGTQTVHGRASIPDKGKEDPGPTQREGDDRAVETMGLDSSHSADCREKGGDGGMKA